MNSTAIPDENPEPKKRRVSKTSKLDLLPTEITSDLHACIAKGFGSKRCRNYMIEMHGDKSALVSCSISAYEHYLKLYGPDIMRSAELEKTLLQTARHDLADLKTVTTTSIPLSDKAKAFNALFDRAETRIRIIELAGESDPRRETSLVQYCREQRAIVESFYELQTAMQKEEPEILKKELEAYTTMLIVCVRKAYEENHGNNHAEEFRISLIAAIKEGMDHWMAERAVVGYHN